MSSAESVELDLAPRCLNCHYVLIGIESPRCPECGRSIDWPAVRAAAGRQLPIERRRGWGRPIGLVHTWWLVVARPRRFARLLRPESSTWLAAGFALMCMAVAMVPRTFVDTIVSPFHWAAGVWFHNEVEALLFFLLDFRRGERWTVRLALWRKVAFYTTAFVSLNLYAGSPGLTSSVTNANFPWVLDPSSWPPDDAEELVRGVVYYWWMIALGLIVWHHLRRKRVFLLILAVLPWVTLAACEVADPLGNFIVDVVNILLSP